jgi:hypothetical protein
MCLVRQASFTQCEHKILIWLRNVRSGNSIIGAMERGLRNQILRISKLPLVFARAAIVGDLHLWKKGWEVAFWRI